LALLSPNGIPDACTYTQLAEAISELSIDSGPQIYDVVLNIFPDNQAILLVAAHDKEVCGHNVKLDPSLQ
jgi:hypothetical protein